MKSIALLLCLVSLTACGNKKDNKPEAEAEERMCFMNCMPKSIVEIVSAPLPSNIMVKFEISGYVFDVVDECVDDEYQMGEVIRGGQNESIQFDLMGRAPNLESKITIFDRGEECDEEDVFFEGTLSPAERTYTGEDPRLIYNLNN